MNFGECKSVYRILCNGHPNNPLHFVVDSNATPFVSINELHYHRTISICFNLRNTGINRPITSQVKIL